jgi:hypothetical protein
VPKTSHLLPLAPLRCMPGRCFKQLHTDLCHVHTASCRSLALDVRGRTMCCSPCQTDKRARFSKPILRVLCKPVNQTSHAFSNPSRGLSFAPRRPPMLVFNASASL